VNLLLDKKNENAAVDIRGPRFSPRGENWTVVVFTAYVTFHDGSVLDITDNFSRKSPVSQDWTRKFSYFFGTPNGDEIDRVFLFDTHGLYGAQGHMHLPNNERLLEGDARLNGFSPHNVDILDICEFIDDHFDGKLFPWVAP